MELELVLRLEYAAELKLALVAAGRVLVLPAEALLAFWLDDWQSPLLSCS
jgi:hypothetical protein